MTLVLTEVGNGHCITSLPNVYDVIQIRVIVCLYCHWEKRDNFCIILIRSIQKIAGQWLRYISTAAMGNLIERQENGHRDTDTQFPQAPVPHLLPGGLGEWKSTMVNIVRRGTFILFMRVITMYGIENPPLLRGTA